MTHFKIVISGYNCFDHILHSLRSVEAQSYRDFEVCIVDDGSTDLRQPEFVDQWCRKHGWKALLRRTNAGAMQAQYEAIQELDPTDGDVIVWVDADDRLAHSEVLKQLDKVYRRDEPLLTYGSYRPKPYDKGCPLPSEYPAECIEANDYRNAYKWGLRYNHLRTVSWDVFKHLDPDVDFKKNGKFFPVSADAAVMIPALELAGGRHKFISDQLYIYTSDNPISEWRKAAKLTNEIHDYIFKLPKKKPL